MKRRRVGLALIIVGLVSIQVDIWAQSVSSYSVSRATSVTFNSIISSGNSFSGWRYSGTFSEDDNRSVATNIGFDFWYNGQRYTQFSVSTNGFLDFSGSADDGGPQCDDYGYCNNLFSSSSATNGTWLALAPFYDDMTTGGGVDPLGTSIKYLLTGTAPNRVLTVEWSGMAVYQNTAPNINFQVKLYESSGRIEYLYGTMNNGGHNFSYSIGINASTISNPPTSAQLLTQQTANSSSFSNSPQNNLSAMPLANSRLKFDSPTPANPTGNLTFTGITNSGMTLNWSNWASNEVGYVLYYSTDGSNYFYQSQTAANATSAAVSGLLPGTTYHWKVYAVTEGALSQALSGNTITLPPGTITSVRSGRWNNATTWDCNCIPGTADNVVVSETHTVRIRNGNANCNDLVIGGGSSGRVRFTQNTGRILTIGGNLIINSGATLEVVTNSNTTHNLNTRGDITNNGTLQLAADANSLCVANFTKTDGNQLISGGGGTTQFHTININKGLKSNILEVSSTNFSCNADALSFVSGGTFKFSSGGTNSITLFNSARAIPSNGSVWMNSASGTINFAASVTVQGDLRVDDGTVSIGDVVNENLISNGGTIIMNGGVLNIAGQLTRSSTESTTSFNQTNGVLRVPTVGSTSTGQAPFNMDVAGSEMNVSGGTIILMREGGNGGQDLGINTSGVTLSNITGGTLQIGAASSPAGQTIGVESGTAIGNLIINSANVTATLQGNDITILNDVTLNSGVLNDNGFEINLSGDWTVISGSYQTSTTGAVNFIGAAQSITSSGTSFSNLYLLGSSTKSITDNLSIAGDLSISSALSMTSPLLSIAVGGDWINNGVFSKNNETLLFNGVTTQNVTGSSTNSISNITVNKSGGVLNFSSNVDLNGTLEIQSITTVDLDGSGSGVFRLVSSATNDARIAALPNGATLTGNMVFEKYFAGAGIKYWRHIGSAVTGASVADIQNEIRISGTFTGNDNGTNGIPVNAFPSLYQYDPSTGLASETFDDRWVVHPSSTNMELLSSVGSEAKGYAIWVRDTGPTTFDLTGLANYGNIDFNISSANEGWNLVANPYPSDIDWDAATGWVKTDIQGGAIHVWNGSQYLTWNGSVGSLGNGRIAKGQGFWVQASAASPVLTATEQVKSSVTTSTYRLSGEEDSMMDMPSIELSLTNDGNVDKSYIQFNKNASEGFDPFDARKLKNAIYSFSTMSKDSVNLAINAIIPSACAFTIPIVIQGAGNGMYNLNWNISEVILSSYRVALRDNISAESHEILTPRNGISFNLDDNSTSDLSSRFYLEFEGLEPLAEMAITTTQNCSNDAPTYISLGETLFNYTYDLSFNDSATISINGTGNEETLDIINYLTTGKNIVYISAFNSSCPESGFTIEYEVYKIKQPTILYNEELNILYEKDSLQGIWYLNDQIYHTELLSMIEADLNIGGVYSLRLENNGCEFKSNELLVTGIYEDLNVADIVLSPNPTIHSISIEFTDRVQVSYDELLIKDLSGRVVFRSENILNEIDVSNFPDGIYILSLNNSSQSISKRFIKQ